MMMTTTNREGKQIIIRTTRPPRWRARTCVTSLGRREAVLSCCLLSVWSRLVRALSNLEPLLFLNMEDSSVSFGDASAEPKRGPAKLKNSRSRSKQPRRKRSQIWRPSKLASEKAQENNWDNGSVTCSFSCKTSQRSKSALLLGVHRLVPLLSL